jgi:hypothetical protein
MPKHWRAGRARGDESDNFGEVGLVGRHRPSAQQLSAIARFDRHGIAVDPCTYRLLNDSSAASSVDNYLLSLQGAIRHARIRPCGYQSALLSSPGTRARQST